MTTTKPEIKTTTESIIDNIVDFISTLVPTKTSTELPDSTTSTTYVPLPLAKDTTTVKSADESTTPKVPIALPSEEINDTTLATGLQEPRDLDEEVTTIIVP